MSDNEIIKALKCLAGEEIMCKDCAFIKLEGHGFACKKNVSTAALDLINRQKAEINELKSEQEILQKLHKVEKDTVKMLQQKCEDCAVRTLRVRIE